MNALTAISIRSLRTGLATVLGLALAGCRPAPGSEQGVRLLHAGDRLEPDTTFELRFDNPVADVAEVGTRTAATFLELAPPLPGEWTWLSRRSGVFRPSEPPTLGRTYELRVSHPSGARLRRTLITPPFGLQASAPDGFNSPNLGCSPEVRLYFNAAVRADTAAPYCEFRDAAGQQVPALVRQALRSDHPAGDSPDTGPYATWAQRFAASRQTSPPGGGPGKPAVAPDASLAHALVLLPARPLPVGERWELRVRQGLPAVDPALRLTTDDRVALGNVIPFALTNVAARTGLNSGRRIQLQFSKSLSPELNPTNVFEWIAVTPTPSNCVAAFVGSTLELGGDFRLDARYQISARRGLPAREPMALTTDERETLAFAPLAPRVYLPATDAEQLGGGRRTFDLLTVNLPSVQLRAKRLDRHTLVHALRGFRSYRNPEPWSDGEYEPFREVDFNVLPGRTVLDTNLNLALAPDAAIRTTLAWDDLLDGARHGALFLTASQPREWGGAQPTPGAQTLVQLTDLGLFWKRSAAGFWVFVFSYESGQPRAGATVRLVTDEAEELASAVTDAAGATALPTNPRADWLVAEWGDDLRAAPIRGSEHELYVDSSRVPVRHEWQGEDADSRRLLLFSERPVYRPGETLHLKALVRDLDERGLRIPDGLRGSLTVFDARDRKFHEGAATFSALGSWDTDVALPTQVRGGYRAELRLGTNQVFRHYFQVQDFRPNAFELSVAAPPALAATTAVRLPVTARYLSGQEVTQGRVRWSLEAGDTAFTPEGFAAFTFGAQVWPAQLGYGFASTSLSGETNRARGPSLVLAPEIPVNSQAPQPRAVEVLVEFTDLNQQTVSARAHFVRHSSDFYLGLGTGNELARAGQAVPLSVVAVGADGAPWAHAVSARLRVRRLDWRSVRVGGGGGSRSYRSEPELTLVTEQTLPTQMPVRSGEQWVVPQAAPSAGPFVPPAAGQYIVEVTAEDSGGRAVLTAAMLYVSGEDRLAWNYRSPAVLELVPDRTNFVAGQTAQVLLQAPFDGTAVVTLERDRVLRSYVTNLTGNAPVLAVPLGPGDAPAVFLSVMLLRGRAASPRQFPEPEYALGYCQLNVEQPETHLDVTVTPSASDVRPGQEVAVEVALTDGNDRPAGDAEVTLYAVDEGVLNLLGYEAPDPWAFFHAVRPLAVYPYCTLPALLPEDPAALRFENKGYLVGGGGSDALRRNFRACAFWHATLRSDAAGRLTARFAAPDGLTRYRVFAVAQTARHQFGRGEDAFRVNKPLMLEPATPAFANVGDRLLARALVRNQTGRTAQLEVGLETDATTVAPEDGAAAGPWRRRVNLADGAAAAVDFPVRFTQVGTARWIWRATLAAGATNDAADAVEAAFPVNDPAPVLREIHFARHGAGATALLAGVNPQLVEAGGEVTVRIGNTRLTELGGALEHLLHYPYGCAEQTVSALLPWLVLAELTNGLPAIARPPAEVRDVVERGLNRLWSVQSAEDGGLAYWPGGRASHRWASAYGGIAVALAARQGFSLPAGRVDRLHSYLETTLRGQAQFLDNEELSDRCLALWALALAGRSQPAAIEHFLERRHRMSAETRAVLALAILESNPDVALAAELLELPAKLPAQDDLWFGCAARELGLRLLARCRLDAARNPTAPATPTPTAAGQSRGGGGARGGKPAPRPDAANAESDRLLGELLAARRDGHWITTQGNAWALLALADYARHVEGTPRAVAATLGWGAERRRVEFPARPEVIETRFHSPAGTALPELTLEAPADARLFVETRVEGRARVAEQPRQDRGLALTRRYDLVNDDGSLSAFANARVGDRVLVTLAIEARQPAHYLAVEDPLPALFEPVNPDFKSQQTQGADLASDWVSDHRELRADRALFFCDHLPPGRYALRYLARVRNAGTALAPSAKAEEMYRPARFGLTETLRVEAKTAE